MLTHDEGVSICAHCRRDYYQSTSDSNYVDRYCTEECEIEYEERNGSTY